MSSRLLTQSGTASKARFPRIASGRLKLLLLGVGLSARYPIELKMGLYDTRITEGYIGVLVNVEEEQLPQVSGILTQAGAVDVVRET